MLPPRASSQIPYPADMCSLRHTTIHSNGARRIVLGVITNSTQSPSTLTEPDASPALRLIGPGELQELFGLSRSRIVVQLARGADSGYDFPPTLAVITRGSIWNLDDVLDWAHRHQRPYQLDALHLQDLTVPAATLTQLQGRAPRIVAGAELQQLLAPLTRARIVQLSRAADFPPPLATLTMGYLWELNDVIAWADRKGRTLDLNALPTH